MSANFYISCFLAMKMAGITSKKIQNSCIDKTTAKKCMDSKKGSDSTAP